MSRPLINTLLVAALCVVPAGRLRAEVSIVKEIEASGNVSVNQPEALTRLLVFTPSANHGEHSEDSSTRHTQSEVRTGYRVQVFDDNNPRSARANAESAERRIRAEFPHLRSYLSFNSPYWRVKVGDFRTRAEAEAAMAEIRQALPSLAPYLRVMRDKINVID